ncbi:MAG: transaldolase [Gammaproteobacteria bacterium]
MTTNPLLRLRELGQSAWLDYIDRNLIESGGLDRLIREDGLAGVTSNPAIFEKAIMGGREYEAPLRALARRGLDNTALLETLMIEDVGRAAELLRPVYDQTHGDDGFVSIEVSPHLARDTVATIAAAQRLWSALERPNIMIKVPATREGLPAIRRLIAAGVNVNVTLLFSVARYREVAAAFLAGLEDRARAGAPLRPVASVASFFLSRIDTLVDGRLDRIGTEDARELRGQAAIASARLAYQGWKEIMATPEWQALARQGARAQRLLWASTSTKNPDYSDLKYVEPLVGPGTVDTFTPETLDAYRDHGNPQVRIEDDLPMARAVPARLAGFGIDIEAVARDLEEQGIRKFVEPYDKLLAVLERQRSEK